MWEEEAVPYFHVHSQKFPGNTEENNGKPVRTAGARDEI
jgi:hypothetical protein